MKEMKVRLTFIEEILGTASNDKELHAEYIASKAPDAISKKEEIEAIGVEGVIEKGKTVFPKDEMVIHLSMITRSKDFSRTQPKHSTMSRNLQRTKQRLTI